MRVVFGLVLILGLALAGFAVYMAQGYMRQIEAQAALEREALARLGPLSEVYIANKDFAYGAPLSVEDVQKMPWPIAALPKGTFTDEAVLFPEGAKPRLFLRKTSQFEPILADNVTEPGEAAGITTRLSKGMRAFAINVDVASGVSGFLRPDDKVDVYWTGSVEGTVGDLTRLIETGIDLIAVDQQADSDSTAAAVIARTVTVAVTPQQVARLAQAQATGRLSLSLVGSGDEKAAEASDVDTRQLLGIEAQAPVVAPEQKICTVKTRKGDAVVEVPIPCTN